MAFTKEQKTQMMAQYKDMVAKSSAVFLVEYGKMTQKDIDALRVKAREVGGELHVVKNTLFDNVLTGMGIDATKLLDKTTLVGFAFNDAPAMAKVVSDASKSEIFSVKGGLLGSSLMTPAQIKALADLPPLPVLRAQFLGVLLAPASKLVRTIAEPGRSLAGVLNAHVEQAQAPAAA